MAVEQPPENRSCFIWAGPPASSCSHSYLTAPLGVRARVVSDNITSLPSDSGGRGQGHVSVVANPGFSALWSQSRRCKASWGLGSLAAQLPLCHAIGQSKSAGRASITGGEKEPSAPGGSAAEARRKGTHAAVGTGRRPFFCSWRAGHFATCFAYVLSLNFHKNPIRRVYLTHFMDEKTEKRHRVIWPFWQAKGVLRVLNEWSYADRAS